MCKQITKITCNKFAAELWFKGSFFRHFKYYLLDGNII